MFPALPIALLVLTFLLYSVFSRAFLRPIFLRLLFGLFGLAVWMGASEVIKRTAWFRDWIYLGPDRSAIITLMLMATAVAVALFVIIRLLAVQKKE